VAANEIPPCSWYFFLFTYISIIYGRVDGINNKKILQKHCLAIFCRELLSPAAQLYFIHRQRHDIITLPLEYAKPVMK